MDIGVSVSIERCRQKYKYRYCGQKRGHTPGLTSSGEAYTEGLTNSETKSILYDGLKLKQLMQVIAVSHVLGRYLP